MSGKVQIAVLSAALAVGSAGLDRAVEFASNNSYLLYAAGRYKLFVGDSESALRLLQRAEITCGAHRVVQPAPAVEVHARVCPRATKG